MDKKICSTAGAIPVTNKKGQVAMKKVKVTRYVAGKRPEYASDSGDENSDVEQGTCKIANSVDRHSPESSVLMAVHTDASFNSNVKNDRADRLKRQITEANVVADPMERILLHRQNVVCENEYIEGSGDEAGDSSGEEEEMNEEQIAIERKARLARIKENQKHEELMPIGRDEIEQYSESDSYEEVSEYEYNDEMEAPRLKPVFVSKQDRITNLEKEEIKNKERLIEEHRKMADKIIKKQTISHINSDMNHFIDDKKKQENTNRLLRQNEVDELNALNTDDEEGDVEMDLYDDWKLRELKRIKQHRTDLESAYNEMTEIERMRNMTEDERLLNLKQNPRIVTNKADKGTYKYLQRYYHRGAFFMDQEQDVYKRNFAEPTLEDKFDKSVLPAVMQVKNFGKASRTKYTHLVDQDTTDFESPWAVASAQNIKFHKGVGGGTKDKFEKPSKKSRK